MAKQARNTPKHPIDEDDDGLKLKPAEKSLDMSDEEIDPVELAGMEDEEEEDEPLLISDDYD